MKGVSAGRVRAGENKNMAVDYASIIRDPNAAHERKAWAAAERAKKEQEMKSNGTWNDNWEPTAAMGIGVSGGGGTTAQRSPSGMQDYLDMQNGVRNSANDVITLGIDRGVNQLNSQKSNVTQGAAQAGKDAWLQYQLANKNVGQEMAVRGQTGGESESVRAGRQMNYENVANSVLRERDNKLNDIDTQIAGLRISGEETRAQLAGEYGAQAMQTYLNLKMREEENKYRDDVFAYGKTQDTFNNNMTLNQEKYARDDTTYDRQLNEANLAAQYGDFSKLRALGYDTAAAEKDYANRNNPYYGKAVTSSRGGGGGGNSDTAKPKKFSTDEIKFAESKILNGEINDEVMARLRQKFPNSSDELIYENYGYVDTAVKSATAAKDIEHSIESSGYLTGQASDSAVIEQIIGAAYAQGKIDENSFKELARKYGLEVRQ